MIGSNNELRNCLASKGSEIWEKEEEGVPMQNGGEEEQKRERRSITTISKLFFLCHHFKCLHIVDVYQRVCTYPRLF